MLRWASGLGLLVLALVGCRAEAPPPKVEAVEVRGTPATTQEVAESPVPSASSTVEPPPAVASRLRGDVTIGPVKTTVPVSNVDRGLAGLRPRFRQCYAKQLESEPSAAGDIDVTFELAPNGEPTLVSVSATATPDSTLPEALGACVVAVVRRATFDPPGPKGSTVTMKLRMRPDTSK